MIRNINVRRLLLFLVTEDRQARHPFSRILVARAAQKVQACGAIAITDAAMTGADLIFFGPGDDRDTK
jgi:hypothetical protein